MDDSILLLPIFEQGKGMLVPLTTLIGTENQNKPIVHAHIKDYVNTTNAVEIRAIAKQLSISNFQTITLNCCHLGSVQCELLFEGLTAATCLQHLNVWECQLGERGVQAIGKFIQTSATLDCVSLRDLGVPETRLRDLLLPSLQLNYRLSWCELWVGIDLCLALARRNASLRWPVVRNCLIDITIALAPLKLPTYVLLWIVNWLPDYEVVHSDLKKIRVIEGTVDSIRKTEKEFPR